MFLKEEGWVVGIKESLSPVEILDNFDTVWNKYKYYLEVGEYAVDVCEGNYWLSFSQIEDKYKNTLPKKLYSKILLSGVTPMKRYLELLKIMVKEE